MPVIAGVDIVKIKIMDAQVPSSSQNSPSLPVVCSFWFGPLSWLERTSIASFIAHGHDFWLYSYDEPENLPEGCTWIDAATIIPRDEMFFYKGNRSPAVFADYFRLMLMARAVGIWVDCDMVCVKPFRDLPPHVFGMEFDPGKGAHAGQINNAVLRLPPDSPLLETLLDLFEDDGRDRDPVWLPWYRRSEVFLRRMMGEKIGLAHMQFGATGPFPLTYFARKLGLDKEALPRTAFYPLPYTQAPRLMTPGTRLDDFTTEGTLGVHLWRMALTERSRLSTPPAPEPGSALADLAKTLSIDVADV
ncbi:MAG: hypothetical protein CML24_03385 [Rhizobiales bacterium]|nr:hypothetical protein [Hyphomicrobiales bacterium]